MRNTARKDGHYRGSRKVNEELVKETIIRSGKDEFTLDTDATLIETEKECAQMTYKGYF